MARTGYPISTGTFAVPNLKGLFIRGAGTQTSGGITYTAGSIGTIQQDQFQGHYHNPLTGQFITSTNTATLYTGTGYGGYSSTTGSPVTDGTNGTPRTGTETRSVNLAMVYCIKI